MAKRRSRGLGSIYFIEKKRAVGRFYSLARWPSRVKTSKLQKDVKDWIIRERGKIQFVKEAIRTHFVRRGTLSPSASWRESGLVFTTDIGTPISPRNLVRHFKSKLRQAGLPEIRFHDLRHTTASLLLEKNGHPKIVSELLGHSTITITLNTYSDIINPINKVASDQMDDMFKV